MLLFRKLIVLLLAAGSVGVSAFRILAANEPEKKKDAPVPAVETAPAAPVTPAPKEKKAKGRISIPLLKDHDSKGLRIPYYDLQGNLQMMFNIGVATRLDDDNVLMKEAQLDSYNEEGEPEMTIAIPTSTLNLETRVITSKTKTTIRRDDFALTGDTVEFNTDTKEGKLVGNVKMLIFSFKNMGAAATTPATPPPKKSPARAPSTPPNTEVKPNE
jgi:hypothetical protein